MEKLAKEKMRRNSSLFMAGGGTPKRNVFLGKNFADPSITNQLYGQPQLKIKYPLLAKEIEKDTIKLSHMSFTTSVTCLI
jgi:hypothetical protein